MASFHYADLNLILAMQWTLHESAAKARQALPKRNPPFYVRQRHLTDYAQGVAVDLPGKALKGKALNALSGALAVAVSMRNALVRHQLPDGRVWVCAVREGSPVPGFDRIEVDAKQADLTVDEILSYMPELQSQRVGDEDDAVCTLDQLIKELDKKKRRASQIIFPGQAAGKVIRVVILAGLMVTTYVMRDWIFPDPPPPPPPAPRPAPKPVAVVPPPAAPVLDDSARDQAIEKARAEFLNAASPLEQLNAWRTVIYSLAPSYYGYRPERAQCEPTHCDIAWTKSDRALPSDTVRLPGKLLDASSGRGARGAPSRGGGPSGLGAIVTRIDVPPVAVQGHSPQSKPITGFLADFVAMQGQGPASIQVNPAKDLVQINPPSVHPNPGPVVLGQRGSWSISGSNLIYVQARLEQFALPGVTLKRGEFDGLLSRSLTVRLMGDYVEKLVQTNER